MQEAGFTPEFAKTVGIAVDHRRTNKSAESLKLNVDRLKEYKTRLVIFPRRANRSKKGDASAEEVAAARQLKGVIVTKPIKESALTFTKLSEVIISIIEYFPF